MKAHAGKSSRPRIIARPRIRILHGTEYAIGPGKAQLLQAIADTGSISAAARSMGMSYRRAWLLIDTMNQCFRQPVVDTSTGGSGGGGAQITAIGREVLDIYGSMDRDAMAAVGGHLADLVKLLRRR